MYGDFVCCLSEAKTWGAWTPDTTSHFEVARDTYFELYATNIIVSEKNQFLKWGILSWHEKLITLNLSELFTMSPCVSLLMDCQIIKDV